MKWKTGGFVSNSFSLLTPRRAFSRKIQNTAGKVRWHHVGTVGVKVESSHSVTPQAPSSIVFRAWQRGVIGAGSHRMARIHHEPLALVTDEHFCRVGNKTWNGRSPG